METQTDYTPDIEAIQAVNAIPAILDVICRTTGMGFATVARVTQERWVACAVLDNINFGLTAGGKLEIGSTLCKEVREFSEPIVVDNFDEDETYRHHHTPALYGLKSYISVPIRLRSGEFFGTLCAIHPEPAKVKNPETIGMFNLYAELIALHLHNNEQLATLQQSLLEEKKIAELREQFIAVLGHDLRNPLGAIKNVAQLLQTGKLDEAAVKRFAGTLLNSYGRMNGLIENLMDFARGRMGGGIALDARDTDIEAPLRHVIEELQLVWPERKIEVNTDLRAAIIVDDKRIAQLFSNLLSNALTYGDARQPIIVSIKSDAGQFRLSVTNFGLPIPQDIMPGLFEPFSRGQADTSQQGLGLGLYISAEIARAHGGELIAESTPEATTFTLLI